MIGDVSHSHEGRIDADRLLGSFMRLCSTDSAPFHEGKIFSLLWERLRELGFEVVEDDAGQRAGGEVGNLIARKEGRGRLAKCEPILLSAHMDRVTGGTGVRPVVVDGVVRSQGDTILGADDAAGLAAIVEACTVLEESALEHVPLEIVFTIAEEVGLVGAQHVDVAKLRLQATTGFVLDADGPVGSIILQAPTQYKVAAQILGMAAHAGVSPEKGVSAIRIAAAAINRMNLGRIDSQTTANIGYIAGGGPTNIVSRLAEFRAEARSLDPKKALRQVEQMERALAESAREYGGDYKWEVSRSYDSFHLGIDAAPVRRAVKALRRLSILPHYQSTGGGSDANVFNQKGIDCVVLGVGFDRIHTFSEYMPVDQLNSLAEMVVELARCES